MRVYYMDALRSVLMALGVVYHASSLYMPSHPWRVHSADSHVLLEHLHDFIHSFRMPAFFLIAGYFCLLTLNKYGDNGFLRLRLQRVMIPLVATALLINPWMNYLSWDTYQKTGFFDYLFDASYFADGTWIGHLWFLNNLLIYFVLAYLGVKLLRLPGMAPARRLPGQLTRAWSRAYGRTLLLAVLLPITNMALPRLLWRLELPENHYLGHFIDLSSLAGYLPYFALGILARREQLLLDAFSNWRFWVGGIAMSTMLTSLPLAELAIGTYLLEYAGYALAWGLVGLCLGLFRRLFDRPSPVFLYFSDASYTIYLLHQLLVVVLGLSLVSLPINVFVKFTLVMGLTFLLTGAAHHFLVLRLPLLRLLFNGKTVTKSTGVGWGGAAPAPRAKAINREG